VTLEEVQNLRQKIARTEKLVAQAEAQMAVHSEKFDDKKKGEWCRNYKARAMFKKDRDRNAQELVELKGRLDAVTGTTVTVR
jgi:hypothetical protein